MGLVVYLTAVAVARDRRAHVHVRLVVGAEVVDVGAEVDRLARPRLVGRVDIAHADIILQLRHAEYGEIVDVEPLQLRKGVGGEAQPQRHVAVIIRKVALEVEPAVAVRLVVVAGIVAVITRSTLKHLPLAGNVDLQVEFIIAPIDREPRHRRDPLLGAVAQVNHR